MNKTLRALITGKVQGVFFRANTKNEADNLGLTGWVKNLPTGEVEVKANGEEENLTKLLKFLQKNPGSSRVEKVRYEYLDEESNTGTFEIKH